jgi:hypothetical protein
MKLTKEELESRNKRLDHAEQELKQGLKALSATVGHRHFGNALMNATMHIAGSTRSKRQVALTKRIRKAIDETIFFID